MTARGWTQLPIEEKQHIRRAQFVLGSERLIDTLPKTLRAKCTLWPRPFEKSFPWLEARTSQNGVILASGDPMSFGIGTVLCRRYGGAQIRIQPAIGAFALASARMGWGIDEYETMSLHGRSVDTLRARMHPCAKWLILCENGSTPGRLARTLCEEGHETAKMTVFSALGSAKEERFDFIARDCPKSPFPSLITLAVQSQGDKAFFSSLACLPDSAFRHDGTLTRQTLRSTVLTLLMPHPGATLWDIGAGHGTVSIDWLRRGSKIACAIEPDPQRNQDIAYNARMLGAPNISIYQARAPEIFSQLPRPDAIFVGGGASNRGMLAKAWDSLPSRGRMVAHGVTLEAEAALLSLHQSQGGTLERIRTETVQKLGNYAGWKPARTITQYAHIKP